MAGSAVMFSTSNTFTSLYRLASMRRAWSRSASTVMVMRDNSGFSVRPTVRESILKARRRNSDATRVSTPGLFSTYTTNVFSIGLLVGGGLHDRAGPPDHLVQSRSGRDHGIDRIFLLHLKINQHRSIVLPGRLNRGHNLRALGHGFIPNPVGVRQFPEIRV